MGIDLGFISTLREQADFATTDAFVIQGVKVDVPVRTPGRRSWQRRVLPDLVPDYPLADAPEKILYDIERLLTDPDSAPQTIPDALSGEFGPLTPLFYAQTSQRSGIPVAFHVTAVKTPERLKCRTLKEHTLLMLCRGEDGELNEDLVTRFLERFRESRDSLNLAQQAFIDAVFPNFNPAQHALVNLDGRRVGVTPFLARPGNLFRRDLETVLAIDLPPSEFFRVANLLIALHFGLLQPRLATVLNRSMSVLYREFEDPDSADLTELRSIEKGEHARSDFTGWLKLRAPAIGESRPLSTHALERQSYREMEGELAELHFSLMMLNRVRDVTVAYLHASGWPDTPETSAAAQYPSQIIERMRDDDAFRTFLDRGMAALAARFLVDQLDEATQSTGHAALNDAKSGLHAMRELYVLHNSQPPAKPWKTRAGKCGIEVTDGVLRRGEHGLISQRHRVGKYFELGVGLLPLLLLLVIGHDRRKITVHAWWEALRDYGLDFASAEREILLQRLKTMGLYERFSDAGEANYIHNLMVGGASR